MWTHTNCGEFGPVCANHTQVANLAATSKIEEGEAHDTDLLDM